MWKGKRVDEDHKVHRGLYTLSNLLIVLTKVQHWINKTFHHFCGLCCAHKGVMQHYTNTKQNLRELTGI